MTKTEVMKLLNKIKAYYPSFYIEDYVVDTWNEILEPYDYEDGLERLKEYAKEEPTRTPQPQTFIKGMFTPEEKAEAEEDYIVDCNLCGKTMLLSQFEEHSKKCLLCKALETKAKDSGKDITYEEFMRMPYEKLDNTYGKLFARKVKAEEIAEQLRG